MSMNFVMTDLSDPQETTKTVERELAMRAILRDVKLDDALKRRLQAAFKLNVGTKVEMYRGLLKAKLREVLDVVKAISKFDENKDLLGILNEPSFADKASMFELQGVLSEAKGVSDLIRQFVDPRHVTWHSIATEFYTKPYIHFNTSELKLMNCLNACGVSGKNPDAKKNLQTAPYADLEALGVKLGLSLESPPSDEAKARREIHDAMQEVRALSGACAKQPYSFKNPSVSPNATRLSPTDVRVLRGVTLMPEFRYVQGSPKTPAELAHMYEGRFGDLKAVVAELLSSSTACGSRLAPGKSTPADSRYTIESTCAKLITGFAANPATFQKQHLNMVLMGDPGMGKTRFAGMIGRVLKGAGILLSEKPVDIISRAELVGQYVGQTAPRTKSRLVSNLESVLVIDEAYRLAVRDPQKNTWDEFGQEAIGEIVNFLDKHKGQLSVIAAGYEKDMRNDFLKINAGMPRRFPIQIMLPPYTDTQLVNIFCLFMGRAGLLEKFEPEALQTLSAILSTPGVRDRVFPNGAGDIENFASVAQTVMSASTKKSINDCSLYNMFKLFCMQTQNKNCKMTQPGKAFCGETATAADSRKRARVAGYDKAQGVAMAQPPLFQGGGLLMWTSSDLARFGRLMLKYDVGCETPLDDDYSNVEFMMDRITSLLKQADLPEEKSFLAGLNGSFYKKWAWSRIKYYLQLADVQGVTRYLKPRRALAAILGTEDFETTEELAALSSDSEFKRVAQYTNALYFVYENSKYVAETVRTLAGFSRDNWVVQSTKKYFGYKPYSSTVKRR
jgi:hypothetical protein